METIILENIMKNKNLQERIVSEIISGKIFIYPTDTVYGLGCDAGNSGSVGKIRALKGSEQPFSVVAPSKEWISENLLIDGKSKKYLDYLPGPYTLILKKKNPEFLNSASSSDSLGVRIPKHPLTEIIQKSGRPFVSTSANVHGSDTIKAAENIPAGLEVDIVIDGGRIENPPSAIIDLTKENPEIKKR